MSFPQSSSSVGVSDRRMNLLMIEGAWGEKETASKPESGMAINISNCAWPVKRIRSPYETNRCGQESECSGT